MTRFLKHILTQQKGFTLIELTIVFTIMAIIGGIGFASYSTFSNRQKLDQAAYDLKAGIDEAKHMAVSRVKPSSCGATTVLDGYRVTVCVSGGNCTVSTNLYEITPICVPSPASPTPLVKQRNPQVALNKRDCGTGPTAVLNFSSQVGLTSGTCSILLFSQDDNTYKTVCVDAGGNVAIKDGNVSC